jgi:hypothetical protein
MTVLQHPIQNEKKVLEEIQELFNLGLTYYARDQKKIRLLDSTDKGDMWKALGAKFPVYQILTDTNWVSYVKNNLMASLYTISKSADIPHTGEHDRALCLELSALLNHIWDFRRVGYVQFKAGERAALTNLGITMVGWDTTLPGLNIDESSKTKTGNVAFKNIDPMKFMRDPLVDELEDGKWCCYYDRYPSHVFKTDPRYKERFSQVTASGSTAQTLNIPALNDRVPTVASKDHYDLVIFWRRMNDGKIQEIHTLGNQHILHMQDDVMPREFPFALLYCNLPGSGLIGVSEPAKIFADNVAYNLMQSIQLTAEYKNQRPPKFVSSESGLNIPAFVKHGDDADRTFIVNGDASKAVHYHQYPFVSATLPMAMQSLMYNIKDSSGVDDRYTGRDTGSIITTGGTQEMLGRVTLIDAPKILLYEEYTARLAKLVLKNLIVHAPKRTYYVKDTNRLTGPGMEPKYTTITMDFPKIDNDLILNYSVQISSELPKNKQRVEQTAMVLMEKQMQYRKDGSNVELLSEEEFISMLDLPYKEQMLGRMGVQRKLDALEETGQVIYEYQQMLEQGLDPNNAMLGAAQGLSNKRQGLATPFEDQMMGQGQAGNTPIPSGVPME